MMNDKKADDAVSQNSKQNVGREVSASLLLLFSHSKKFQI